MIGFFRTALLPANIRKAQQLFAQSNSSFESKKLYEVDDIVFMF